MSSLPAVALAKEGRSALSAIALAKVGQDRRNFAQRAPLENFVRSTPLEGFKF